MIYEFNPTQSYNGYDKPWAPGAGANLIPDGTDTGNGYISNSFLRNTGGVAASQNWYISEYFAVTAGATYTLSCNNTTASNPSMCFYDSNKEYLSGIEYGAYTKPYTFTVPENAVYARASQGIVFATNGTQIEAGSTASPVTPFRNICPISGYNIWDPDNAEFIQVYAGYVNTNTRELYLRPVYQEYAGEELVGPWMSSMDEYSEDATPTEGAFVIDFGGELTSLEITPFMLQTLLDSLGIRQHFTDGAGLLNKLMDQAQGRVRSEEELLHLSRPLNVIAIGDQLPAGITFKPISKDVLPGLPGKFIR